VINRRVYTRYIFESENYRRRLRELVTEQDFDLVHADSLDLSAYFNDLGDLPIACTHHNVESALLARRSKVEGTPLSSAYMRQQARWMEKEEQIWAPRVAMNVLCSTVDMELLQKLAPGSAGAVIPNGVDIDEFQPIEADQTGSSFVGAMSWFPNLDALEYFADDILPHLRAELPDHPVTWAGSATDEQKARFGARGIHLTGYVDDVRPYMARASTFVVPLRAGGGTRLKILNAWSMGCAVVSTSLGCEGLEAVDGENILIRDDPRAFAKAIIQLERDEELRARLGAAARRTAQAIYSWTVIGRDLVALYERIAASNRHD
jgi:glycosyltransferase involved in cell wall biosynthesis